VAIVIYAAISIGALLLADPLFEWSRVAIRIVYLTLITALLAYLGAYQEQLRSELASLAAWPREVGTHLDAILRTSLGHAAEILRSARVLFVWEEPEEPWIYTAVWENRELRVERAAPGRYDFAELPPTSFLARDTTPPSILALDGARRTISEEPLDAIGDILRSEHGIRSGVGVTIRSESVSGRLIAAQDGAATADDLVLADIVGRLLLGSLEQFFFVRQLRQTASAEERLRIARDLHDGVIQSLSGTGLQLESIRSELATDPAAAAERLAHVQRVIEREQHELRDLVGELRPGDPGDDGATDLEDRLRQLEERFLLEWNMTVDVHSSLEGRVPPAATVEICRIVNESLSNAARHGRASRASVEIDATRSNVRIRVSDNGRGFPFSGRHDLDALRRLNQGPKTVKERVTKLGGTLLIDSSPNGAAVEAVFPLPTGVQ
jgi:signal transduction histidine kinase